MIINDKIKLILETVYDPEIPVLSIMEMGVVIDYKMVNNIVEVTITPTYSGCPAMDVISIDIKKALNNEGYESKIKRTLSPPWTTDLITEKGRKAIEKYGISAPLNETADKDALLGRKKLVRCPQCKKFNTKLISQFGSTACKALFKCNSCLETFDYFKCLK